MDETVGALGGTPLRGAPGGAIGREAADAAARRVWAEARAAIERQRSRGTWYDRCARPIDTVWGRIDWRRLLGGVYRRGVRNALDIELRRIDVAFDALPGAFDGYTVLHLSDLHLDSLEDTAGRVAALVAGLEVDACALTGDFADSRRRGVANSLDPLGRVIAAVAARDGLFATLGNHDSAKLVEPLERLGVRVLVNERVAIERGGARIHLTGLDDVHYFYTEKAREALLAAPEGFNVALVHSPEIVETAARAGFAFYLTGHTHGGQICLPGGRPIVTNLRAPRAYAAGLWRCRDMTGYTSTGAGVSIPPLRFNVRGEVTLITLRRARPGGGPRPAGEAGR